MAKRRSNSLETYHQKRDFRQTPEPRPKTAKSKPTKRSRATGVSRHKPAAAPARAAFEAPKQARRVFVVQMHDATRLHYDFRLEVEGVLVSWAIPKGPSLNPADKHLAVKTEDHPLEYAAFEGVIPENNYGAGTVVVWDGGVYENLRHDKQGNEVPMSEAVEQGHVVVFLEGAKLRGKFALQRTSVVRGRENWIFVKMRDSYASEESPVRDRPESILSGRTLEEVSQEGARQQDESLHLA